ncbi:MAG: thioesterase family protein [Ignavibacteriaceae bacterium]
MEEITNFKHVTKIKIRFSDLDAMKHVNNATYLTYLEEARIKYFNDLLKKKEGDIDYQAVIGRIEIDYLYPIVLGDDLEIYTRISRIGNKSVDVKHIIAIKRGSKLIKAATSTTKLVYFDYKTKTTKPIPDEERKLIEEFEGMDS